MLGTINLPNQVYLVALDLMSVARPTDPQDAPTVLRMAEGHADYRHPWVGIPGGTREATVTAFGAALAMFVSLSGPFSEDGGEFASVNGWCSKD